jgi:hypothetical protein
MTLRNRRGVIAATYDELQSVPGLRAAREARSLAKASPESSVRAVLQAAEIALLNLVDLQGRAAADVDQRAYGTASVKLSWAGGFHRVLLMLGIVVQRFGRRVRGTTLHVGDSPAFLRFLETLQTFDRSVAARDLPIRDLLADDSFDRAECRLLHLARMQAHEATIWEAAFGAVRVGEDASYDEYVAAEELRKAVEEMRLEDDTFFTQFRGLHQIPEILAAEVNDRLETAIRLVRERDDGGAVGQLDDANALMQVIVACVPAMADNLATADYHRIRENLGVTSGAHSAALHYHLFHDLYSQLATAIVELGGGDDATSLLDRALQLRALIDCWRVLHMHLPRNNVGGVATKSLAGSPDAIEAVRSMRGGAALADPLRHLAADADAGEPRESALQHYLQSDLSLDSRLLAATGEITKKRFADVQRRSGIYAEPPPFVPPPKRTVD